MVAVLHSAPEVAEPEALAAWTDRVSEGFAPDERVKLLETLGTARELYGDRCAPDGEPWLDRALGTAAIVAGLKLDLDSVRAAIMIGAPHIDGFDAEAFSTLLGAEVAQLVSGVARMGAIRAIPEDAPAHDRDAHSESLRKMLLAMVGDIRVVLIKLAERTQALRALGDLSVFLGRFALSVGEAGPGRLGGALQSREDVQGTCRQTFSLRDPGGTLVSGRAQACKVVVDRLPLPSQVVDAIPPAGSFQLRMLRGGAVRAERFHMCFELASD